VSQLSGPTFTANEREEIINAFALSEAAKKNIICAIQMLQIFVNKHN